MDYSLHRITYHLHEFLNLSNSCISRFVRKRSVNSIPFRSVCFRCTTFCFSVEFLPGMMDVIFTEAKTADQVRVQKDNAPFISSYGRYPDSTFQGSFQVFVKRLGSIVYTSCSHLTQPYAKAAPAAREKVNPGGEIFPR